MTLSDKCRTEGLPLEAIVPNSTGTPSTSDKEISDSQESNTDEVEIEKPCHEPFKSSGNLAGAATAPHRTWYNCLNPLKWGGTPPVPTERSISREYNAGWLSQMTFQWMTPIMSVGYRRPLELNDIWLVNPDRRIDLLTYRFGAAFQTRVDQGATNPLLGALHDTFRKEFWLGAVCVFFSSICQVMTPFALRFLIQAVTASYNSTDSTDDPEFGRQIGLVFTIMLMQLIQSAGTNQFIYRGFMVGVQARGVLVSAIFEKSLKISSRARAGTAAVTAEDQRGDKQSRIFDDESQPDPSRKKLTEGGTGWSNGRVMNMMSTDTSRIEQACGMIHLIWASPMTILLALALLLINITYSALAGFALLFAGIPLLTVTMRSLINRRKGINHITDSRVSLTQEILRSARFVKYYGWERAFLQTLGNLRKREVISIQKLLAIRNAMNAVSVSLPIFASMLSFIVYSLADHELTAAIVFSSLSIFNSLRVPFNLLPVVIGQLTDAWASIRRIEEYLLAEERQDEFIYDLQGAAAIAVKQGSFVWEATENDTAQAGEKCLSRKEKSEAQREGQVTPTATTTSATSPDLPFALENIELTIERAELVAVIGSVGSGKSSLLAALAGEMRQTGAQVTMGATKAFCPQYAWIQNATVKENILFGKEMDQEWYDKVIHACALQADLAMLPAGDDTEIGERGITLSGGQRQRLNIARAIYFGSDIILLDDPLSAVDAHVSHHLFEHAICGLLHGKCRILATHRRDILARCDRIIWMEAGRVRANGTFRSLVEHDRDFRDLLSSTGSTEVDVEKNPSQPQRQHNPLPESSSGTSTPGQAPLIQQEERSTTSVEWGVYAAYLRASGSIFNGLVPLLLLVLAQTSNILTNLWLSYWTDHKFPLSKGQYIAIYVGLGVIQACLMFSWSLSVSILATTASREMMSRALAGVLKAPMTFFDTTPLGRIMNRFSKDVDTMDNGLADAIRMYLYTLAMIISVFVLVIVYFHYFGIALAPLLLLFLATAAYYRASARDMKRHEAVLRSVVFARFSEALTGTASIHAYGMQGHFTSVLRRAIDNMNSAYYLTFSNQRWLSTRLDVVSILLVVSTGILVVTLRNVVSPSISGLLFSYILAIVQMIQLLVKQFAELENAMNATERVHFYGTRLDQEEGSPNAPGSPPIAVAKSWPEYGAIEFDGVQMRYRPGLPLVLKGLHLHVAGGERLGIIGRTGAGKSSIMSALFRLTDLAGGSIKIDGVDIARVSCHDLRSRLSIIPQDPTLFRGTVRTNLDPFHQHSDLELWSALREAGLVKNASDQHFASSPSSPPSSSFRILLDTPVEEEGLNFSLGQRQMMALARALVRGSRIVVCDEATSSVDVETDLQIQETIRTSFRGRTLLCIAHRLQTIIKYDRVCVMDRGQIVELDTPLRLWERSGSIFRGMCDQSGIVKEDFL